MDRIDGPVMAGRTVLVTGAASGIGGATALGLVRLGPQVAIVGRPPRPSHDPSAPARLWEASAGLVGLAAAVRA